MSQADDWKQWLDETIRTLGIDDSAVIEYIVGICEEDTIDPEEKQEAICEYLSELNEDRDAVEEFVAQLLEHLKQHLEKLEIEQQESKAQYLKTALELEKQDLQTGASDVRPHNAPKVLTKEERKQREALLAQYGYDIDQVVENANGETEIVYTSGKSEAVDLKKQGLFQNRNADVVKEQEQNKRTQAQLQHQKEQARIKEQQEKQRLEREKEKRRTQKREKRRM
ncbi:uncharacterized protein BJ171DRAFT_501540 [Polychytrium aggregatum]|uniref:uncharacterized protein n=1 Tax=Polychytrium aggregatum TaxID=110093 RepID=UPI0022FE8FC9|nr:uncharacterized protein BJ171DRAFT_501540 [Polychytrium aggregatum]KAI9205263.1 hypothetical protein BJ171DRAFT_501540 [Polychytrium aggregatum]